jgi:sortase (surface protein transpeptidase)
VVPGQRGSAVLLGHNYYEGYAVFKYLVSLRKGNRLSVHRSDGKTVNCRVSKNPVDVRNPSDRQVASWYDPNFKGRRLMLITCGDPQGGGVYHATTVVETRCSQAA